MKTILLGAALALLGVTAAQAIDCTKAADDLEKTICGSPDLLKADDAMSAAYAAAIKAVGPKMAKVLKADQQDWDTYRYENCTGDDEDADAKALLSCLIEDTRKRADFLGGGPIAGPGLPEALMPQVLVGADELYDEFMRFAGPKTDAEKAFNAWIDKEIKQLHFAKTEDESSDWYQLVLAYLSPALLSANIDLTSNDAGPHPMVTNYSLNLDMATGKVLTMADALDEAALKTVEDACVKQLGDYVAPGDEGADVRADNIHQSVVDLDHWTFYGDHATIRYADYDAQPAVSCDIGYDVLKPLMKATFPLPA